jgi:hypothetical protein
MKLPVFWEKLKDTVIGWAPVAYRLYQVLKIGQWFKSWTPTACDLMNILFSIRKESKLTTGGSGSSYGATLLQNLQ